MNTDFQRISRLPPYVFNVIGEMRQEARARGEDIIDLSMGNPDQPTPEHIVKKLAETAERGDTHRYSQSKREFHAFVAPWRTGTKTVTTLT